MPPKYDQSKQYTRQGDGDYHEEWVSAADMKEQNSNNVSKPAYNKWGAQVQYQVKGQAGNAHGKRNQNKGSNGPNSSASNFRMHSGSGSNVGNRPIQNFRDVEINSTCPSTCNTKNGPIEASVNLASDGISSTEVLSVMSCPVCYEILRPPIFMCQSGHSACVPCRKKTQQCPLCREGYTNVRNFVAESLVETCTFKCDYSEQGCVAMFKGNKRDSHMNICNFRPLGCEVFPCSTKHIPYNEFVKHMKKSHRAEASPANQNRAIREVTIRNMDKLMRQSVWTPFIMECFENTFFQYSQVIGGKIWFWVSLLGTPEDAGRFEATITISSQEMKSIWIGPVHSVRHSGNDIYLHGICMVTTEECLKAFIRPNQRNFSSFRMEVSIEKLH